MLKLLAAAGHADFKNELVGAVEIVRGAIDGNECWHFGGKALLVIGDLERAALDVDGAMRRRADESDRWQRAGGAIRPDIAVDATRTSLPGAALTSRSTALCAPAGSTDARSNTVEASQNRLMTNIGQIVRFAGV
jgi:hypothetical protein